MEDWTALFGQMSIKNSFKNIPQNSFPNDNCQQSPSPLYAKTVLQMKLNSSSPPHPQLKYPLNKARARQLAERSQWNHDRRQTLMTQHSWWVPECKEAATDAHFMHSGEFTNGWLRLPECTPHLLFLECPSYIAYWWTIKGLKTQVKNQHFRETKGVWGTSPHPKGKNGSPGLTTLT